MGRDGSRDQVCDLYDAGFEGMLLSNNAAQIQFNALAKAARKGDIALGCWCAPERCHAQTIKRELEVLLSQGI